MPLLLLAGRCRFTRFESGFRASGTSSDSPPIFARQFRILARALTDLRSVLSLRLRASTAVASCLSPAPGVASSRPPAKPVWR